jgi:hypothetical protein
MTFTECFRQNLDGRLGERGSKAELARWLVKKLGGALESRQVQIAKFLGGAGADAEFVLAVQCWMDGRKRRRSSTDG